MVVIGCPVRNRDWIIGEYLDHIYNLDFPKDDLSLCFVINDSTDRTKEILMSFAREHKDEYRQIRILEHDLGQIEDQRTWNVRKKIYVSLAELRNILVEQALDMEADYLFSVDSDILVPPYTLKELIVADKDIVSAQIWNDPSKVFPNIMAHRNGSITHYLDFPKNALFQCDVTGAVYLLKKKVLEEVRYCYHEQGEDVGFCLEAKKKGFEIWANSKIACKHMMERRAPGF
ncbi:MAG: hypothetical protein HPY71_11505 [Firmicutes bacterium]|nr:hypothetical protein [Bacillota bacterium]